MPVIRGTNGNDVLPGTAARDRIYGLLGDDTLTGLEGNDFLYGQGGADSLDGGIGNDFLYGGEDSDLDTVLGNDGDDRVQIFANDVALGGAGIDTLVIDGFFDFLDPVSINLADISSSTAVAIGWEDNFAGQFENVDIYMEGFFEGGLFVNGSDGDDIITVDSCGCGIVELVGGRGDDEITGGFGDDVLRGGHGDDIVFGLIGTDTLSGGKGQDMFQFDVTSLSLPSPPSWILDFTAEDYLLVTQEYEFFPFDEEDPLVVGSDPVPTSELAQFLYDTDDGYLYLDPDGSGIEESFLIFTLRGIPTLTASQIVLDLSGGVISS